MERRRGDLRPPDRAIESAPVKPGTIPEEVMANSKSKHIRVKSRRRQQWKARKKRQKAATKATKK